MPSMTGPPEGPSEGAEDAGSEDAGSEEELLPVLEEEPLLPEPEELPEEPVELPEPVEPVLPLLPELLPVPMRILCDRCENGPPGVRVFR